MTKQQIIEARRILLASEISRLGLSVVAKLAGKPDRQIKDMATGRKSFGDGVSIQIGPKIRPDLPRDWLVYPDESAIIKGEAAQVVKKTETIPTLSVVSAIKPTTERDTWLVELASLAGQLDLPRIGMLVQRAHDLVAEMPAKQTPASSQ